MSNLVFENLKELLSLSFHDLDILLRYGMSLRLGLSCDASCLGSLYIFDRNITEVGFCPKCPCTRRHMTPTGLYLGSSLMMLISIPGLRGCLSVSSTIMLLCLHLKFILPCMETLCVNILHLIKFASTSLALSDILVYNS